MKKWLLKCSVIAIIALNFIPASAEVTSTPKPSDRENILYVAGDTDNYPLEYYDSGLNEFRGIIPDILNKISDYSGIDFVYINWDKTDKYSLAENSQVDLVSSVTATEKVPMKKDYLELISYSKMNNNEVHSGIVFTSRLNDETIAKIKNALNNIPSNTITGIYLSYASKLASPNSISGEIALILCILLITFICVLLLKIRRIKTDYEEDKLTDPETGLGNLPFFKYYFKHNICDKISSGTYNIAYIILDSGYLRSYHGENSFEEVLKYTTYVLSEYTGDEDISARITENGFVYSFCSKDSSEAKKRLIEIMDKLNGFRNSSRKSKPVFHCASYELSPTDKNIEILLFSLRRNCNEIIGTEKQIVFCDISSMNKVQEKKKITESILNGFEKNEFKMYLQFIVNNKTKKITSAEALSRWDNPQKGLVGPGNYIKDMESSSLISRHDFYMFELVCKQLEKWNNTEFSNVSISCNFTRITLSEENFMDKLIAISGLYNFDKTRLAIEITEDAIEKDREVAKRNAALCKEHGFKVYLDDMGSGYTSLANLCDYPIDIVKIDRDILLKAATQKGKDLLSGIVKLAHSLNLSVICEGVETEEQNAILEQTECDYIQGWYYSKPIPAEESECFIEKHNLLYK